MMRIKLWLPALLILPALYGIINGMGKSMLTLGRYRLSSAKISAPVTIAVIADLHNTRFGKDQSRLIARVREAAPDAVAIVGDAFHSHAQERHTLSALSQLAAQYPCYFVIGNHERKSGECADIKKTVRALGVTVLEGDSASAVLNGQAVQLCGLDDFSNRSMALMHTQLTRVSEGVREDALSLLLVHRPERFSEYLPCGFDVILCGHAHGGQWRIPGAKNGFFAPGQGWLPQYAGGLYTFGEQAMLVSRGLSGRPLWLARFGNPPEILLLTIDPA